MFFVCVQMSNKEYFLSWHVRVAANIWMSYTRGSGDQEKKIQWLKLLLALSMFKTLFLAHNSNLEIQVTSLSFLEYIVYFWYTANSQWESCQTESKAANSSPTHSNNLELSGFFPWPFAGRRAGVFRACRVSKWGRIRNILMVSENCLWLPFEKLQPRPSREIWCDVVGEVMRICCSCRSWSISIAHQTFRGCCASAQQHGWRRSCCWGDWHHSGAKNSTWRSLHSQQITS